MNKARRAVIDKIVNCLGSLETDCQLIAEEERQALENLPEQLQDSDRGQAMDQAADQLEEAADLVAQAIELLNEAAA